MSWRDSLRQYGAGKLMTRLAKRALRAVGIDFESYYLLYRDLTDDIPQLPLAKNLRAAELRHEDFLHSRFFELYSAAKRDLYARRFSDPAWRAFGVYMDSELVYVTWIARDVIRIEHFGWERRLKRREGLLVDSFTLPEARRLGIHSAMNGFRIRRLREAGVERAYVVYLAANTPAARTQRGHGFRRGWKLRFFRIGSWRKLWKKPVFFDKAHK